MSPKPRTETKRTPSAAQRDQAQALLDKAARSIESDPQQARRMAERALRTAQAARREGLRAKALRYIGAASWQVGELDRALDAFSRGLASARRARDRTTARYCLNGLGVTLDRLGDFESALAYLRRFVEESESEGDAATYVMGVVNIGHVLERMGLLDDARERYERALARVAGQPPIRGVPMLYLNLGVTHAIQGRHEQALECMTRAVDGYRATDERSHVAHALTNAARQLSLLGRYREAGTAIQEAIALAQQLGAAQTHWRALIVLGYIHIDSGDVARAISVLHQGMSFEPKVRERELVRMTHEALVTAYEGAGDFASALKHHKLLAALEIESLRAALGDRQHRAPHGARDAKAPPASSARTGSDRPRAVRLPAAPRSRGPGPLATLSAREREVLGYLGEGLSNSEIGQALAISVNTVRFHVATIFNKLGVSRRIEAAKIGAEALNQRQGVARR